MRLYPVGGLVTARPGAGGRVSGVLRSIEQCPACGGEVSAFTWFCGSGGCDTEESICRFCGGAGVVIAGRAGWAEIGDRLRWARSEPDRWWGYDGTRLVWTLDEKRRERGPIPLKLEAHRHRIPAEMLDAIERGVMDPRAIAKTAGRSPVRPKQELLL